METAAKVGIGVLEFWELTPSELAVMTKAYYQKLIDDNNQQISIAYITAYLHRVERMPKLTSLLNKVNVAADLKPEPSSMEKMFAQVQSLNTAMGGTTIQ